MKIFFLLMATTTGALAQSATNEPTVVTSDRMQADYLHNVGTFEGNVLAVDPRLTVRADKMVVTFGTTGTNANRSVQKLVAIGSVVINKDTKKATCEQADYTTGDGKVVLTGNPKLESPDGTVTGKKITLWHGQEKMDVESDVTDTNRTRLIIFPEEIRNEKKTE